MTAASRVTLPGSHDTQLELFPSSATAGAMALPLSFHPIFKARVWGGRQIEEVLSRSLPGDGRFGESWEISGLQEHVSLVEDGPHAGRTLTELWNSHRRELCGKELPEDSFPLLFKWLDCHDWLSVQVHPDDQFAQKRLGQPRGKSEAWIILRADSTARIYAGLKHGVTREVLLRHISAGTVDQCLHSFTPRPGDCVSFPAGTVHAAGGGLLIAEVQQSSDTTFRLFDWNRSGPDGVSRPLHVDLALEAIDWTQGPVSPSCPRSISSAPEGSTGEVLVDSSQFVIERHTLSQTWNAPHAGLMTVWMVLAGQVRLNQQDAQYERDLATGQTVLVPAAAGTTTWTPSGQEGSATLLCVHLP